MDGQVEIRALCTSRSNGSTPLRDSKSRFAPRSAERCLIRGACLHTKARFHEKVFVASVPPSPRFPSKFDSLTDVTSNAETKMSLAAHRRERLKVLARFTNISNLRSFLQNHPAFAVLEGTLTQVKAVEDEATESALELKHSIKEKVDVREEHVSAQKGLMQKVKVATERMWIIIHKASRDFQIA